MAALISQGAVERTLRTLQSQTINIISYRVPIRGSKPLSVRICLFGSGESRASGVALHPLGLCFCYFVA